MTLLIYCWKALCNYRRLREHIGKDTENLFKRKYNNWFWKHCDKRNFTVIQKSSAALAPKRVYMLERVKRLLINKTITSIQRYVMPYHGCITTAIGLTRFLSIIHIRSLVGFTCSNVNWIDGWVFNAVFNMFLIISRRPIYLHICFLAFSQRYSTQHSFQATRIFSTKTINPLVENLWCLSNWLLSNIGKNVVRVEVRSHNARTDSQRRHQGSVHCNITLEWSAPRSTCVTCRGLVRTF